MLGLGMTIWQVAQQQCQKCCEERASPHVIHLRARGLLRYRIGGVL